MHKIRALSALSDQSAPHNADQLMCNDTPAESLSSLDVREQAQSADADLKITQQARRHKPQAAAVMHIRQLKGAQ